MRRISASAAHSVAVWGCVCAQTSLVGMDGVPGADRIPGIRHGGSPDGVTTGIAMANALRHVRYAWTGHQANGLPGVRREVEKLAALLGEMVAALSHGLAIDRICGPHRRWGDVSPR